MKDVVEYIEKHEVHNEASEYFYARKNSLKTKEKLKRNISISTNNKSRQYKI